MLDVSFTAISQELPHRRPYWVRKIVFFFKRFPPQLWIVFLASFIVSLSSSMGWPYLNIYLRQRLGLPLHLSTMLASTRAISGIAASLTIGTFSDKFGRRGIILASVVGGVFFHVLMGLSNQVWEFLLLLAVWGALDNFYSVGCNAMIVDLSDRENQLEAFALNRMAHNTGIAIGPIVGGILASRSYQLNYGIAAVFYFLAVLLAVFFLKETLGHVNPNAGLPKSEAETPKATRMSDVLRDKVFILAAIFLFMITIGSATVFTLLPLYAREVYGIPESRISIVFSVNALLCVFLQLVATRFAVKIHPFHGMIFSAGLYTIAISSYAFFPSVAWYCLCMTVQTIGEIILSPTMLSLTARRAPADARARYMGILNLSYPVGSAVGPALAGSIFERIAPQAIWINGGIFAFFAMIGYILLNRSNKNDPKLVMKH